MPARRNPRPISASLPAVLGRAAPKTMLAAVQTAWPAAAGDAIAREADPVSERDGVVTVACSSASWAEQLDLLQNELLQRLGEALGDDQQPRSLRFRVGDRPGSKPLTGH